MSADLLREAAALMRQRAEAWHPAVALAVADWLDGVAHTFGTPGHREWHHVEVGAVRVARAYLERDQ